MSASHATIAVVPATRQGWAFEKIERARAQRQADEAREWPGDAPHARTRAALRAAEEAYMRRLERTLLGL